ncbi:MAG: nicotinate-nucleotide adenylyltransferase, partial [Propionicimonas sp.]|nr:nicotinate-nucleotide adenylyltransferase [Propionicimonas sp.]
LYAASVRQSIADLLPVGFALADREPELLDTLVGGATQRAVDQVDTLRDIRRQRGADWDLFFITGADALSQILTWHGAEELFDLAQFVGVSRPGVPLGESDIAHLPEDKVSLLEIPALAISSTACRERVAAGLPIWYLVPDGIVQYIAKRGLYVDQGVS